MRLTVGCFDVVVDRADHILRFRNNVLELWAIVKAPRVEGVQRMVRAKKRGAG